jgi:hypothetical protein
MERDNINTPIKICLIGLPRSGSLYVSTLISNSLGDTAQNLAEPFTIDHTYNIAKSEHNNLLYATLDFPEFNSYREQVNYVLDTLKNGNPMQSLVLKLFFMDPIYTVLDEILNELRNLNFQFLILKRKNIEHQLISWLVASSTGKWSIYQGLHHEPVYINKDRLNSIIFLYRNLSKFDNMIKKYNIDAKTIYYEQAVLDLENYLNMPIVTTNHFNKKQLPADPYDIIENVEEVKEFLEKLLKNENNTNSY